MSDFSDKLKKYMKRNGHTTASLSKLCNIDRTVFHKYGTGDRFPSNIETVSKVKDLLLVCNTNFHRYRNKFYTTFLQ